MTSAALARVPEAVLADLRRRYGEPGRHYHSWAHIEALLRWFAQRADTLNDPDAVVLAILFHDAVYDARRSDNETLSAALLAATPLPGWSPASIAAALRMIEATAGHQPPDGLTPEQASDLKIFLDMDLSILGASPSVFAAYDRAIRREYRHVPWPIYGMARKRILGGFLERPALYFSDWGRETFETAARANLQRKLGVHD